MASHHTPGALAALVAAGALLVAFTGAAAGAAGASAAAQPGIGIRLVDAPTAKRDDQRARSYVVDHVRPGARFSRRFEVTNGTATRVTLALYPAAATIDGDRFTVAPGRGRNELSGWISVSPGTVRLEPGAKAVATLSVAVPDRAAAGERYAAVLAELPAQRTRNGGVGVASRVGIRVYLSVGRGGEPVTDFEITSLTAERDAAGVPAVRARVRNTGGRAIDVSGELMLRDEARGFAFGRFPARVGTTLRPGDVGDAVVPLDASTPGGSYDADITLRSGPVSKTATARLTLPDAAGTAGAAAPARPVGPATAHPFVVGIATTLLAVLLLALAGVSVLRRRSAARRGREAPAVA